MKKLSKWQGIALKALFDLDARIYLYGHGAQPRFYSAKEVCDFIEINKQLTLKSTSRIDNALRKLHELALVDFGSKLGEAPKYRINMSGRWYVRASLHLLDDCHGAD